MKNSPILFVEFIVGPLILLLYIRIKAKRITAKRAAEGYAEPTFGEQPVAPKQKHVTRLVLSLLPNLTGSRRSHLSAQLDEIPAFFYGGMYFSAMFPCAAVFQSLPIFHSVELDPSSSLWYDFLSGWSSNMAPLFLLAFGAAFILSTHFKGSTGMAAFYRTRPLSIGFLFWSRTLIATITLALAVTAGYLVSMFLLVLTHGFVWRTLPVVPNAIMSIALAQSPAKVALSCILFMLLLYSLLFALLMIGSRKPGRTTPGGKGILLWLMPLAVFFVTLATAGSQKFAHALFFYRKLGDPPPNLAALLPIALVVLFLFGARRLMNRIEL